MYSQAGNGDTVAPVSPVPHRGPLRPDAPSRHISPGEHILYLIFETLDFYVLEPLKVYEPVGTVGANNIHLNSKPMKPPTNPYYLGTLIKVPSTY